MTNAEINSTEAKDILPERKDIALLSREEKEAKLKQLGIKAPGYIRGMMDEISDISILFLE